MNTDCSLLVDTTSLKNINSLHLRPTTNGLLVWY